MENKENFTYTYSAAQQQEVQNIRQKYLPQTENKLERLRSLHRQASRVAQIWAITLGVVGSLIMGGGMSLAMTDLGEVFGLDAGASMLIGIIVGVAGLCLVALAYPVYNSVLQKQRQRIAPEVLRLSEELLQ